MLDALADAGVEAWVAGGFGIDMLTGEVPELHRDIDIVLPDFENDRERASKALSALDYRVEKAHIGGQWMPTCLLFRSPAGHLVELLGIDWSHVQETCSLGSAKPDVTVLRAAAVRVGSLAGRTVRCLSLEAQLLFHSGYRLRLKDERSLRRLHDCLLADVGHRATRSPLIGALVDPSATTSLLIPVQPTRRTTRWRLLSYGLSPLNLPPHITLTYPFAPAGEVTTEVLAGVRELLTSTPWFRYRLDRVEWFGRRVVYLAPEPSTTFATLATRLGERFPEWPPYGGAFTEAVPHMTVSSNRPRWTMRLKARVATLVVWRSPDCGATEAWLMAMERSGEWRFLFAFPLGGAEPMKDGRVSKHPVRPLRRSRPARSPDAGRPS